MSLCCHWASVQHQLSSFPPCRPGSKFETVGTIRRQPQDVIRIERDGVPSCCTTVTTRNRPSSSSPSPPLHYYTDRPHVLNSLHGGVLVVSSLSITYAVLVPCSRLSQLPPPDLSHKPLVNGFSAVISVPVHVRSRKTEAFSHGSFSSSGQQVHRCAARRRHSACSAQTYNDFIFFPNPGTISC